MPNYSEAIEQQLALARELRELVEKHNDASTAPTLVNSARAVRGATAVLDSHPAQIRTAASVQHEARDLRRSLRNVTPDFKGALNPAFQQYSDAESGLIALGLELATPVFVSREMVDMISGALPSLPETTTIMASDLPARVSWIWLEKPIVIPTLTPGGYQHHARAFLVSTPSYGQITVIVFGHSTQPGRPPMTVTVRGQKITVNDFQYLTRLTWQEWKTGDTVAHNAEQLDLQQTFCDVYADGRPYVYSYVDAEEPYFKKIDVEPMAYAATQHKFEWELRAIVAGIIHFMAQRMVVLQTRRLDRAAKRRMPEWREVPILDVVLLRRKSYPARDEGSEEHEPVDWACRWVVSAHWRNQWYPSEGRHKPKLIMPYVKGPEDKPVRNATKLFAVVR